MPLPIFVLLSGARYHMFFRPKRFAWRILRRSHDVTAPVIQAVRYSTISCSACIDNSEGDMSLPIFLYSLLSSKKMSHVVVMEAFCVEDALAFFMLVPLWLFGQTTIQSHEACSTKSERHIPAVVDFY